MDLINKYLKEQTPGYEYEYNYEGDMAKTQLNMMLDAATELKMMLDNDTNLPEWVQSKITKAADYIDSARDYMKNMNKDTMGEEVKTGDTGWRKSQTNRRDQFGNPVKNVARSLARQGMRSAIKDLKKGPEAGKRQVEDVEEIDELKEPTVQKYITRAKFSTNPKRRAMAQKAQSKLQQKQNPMKTEEVELDEAMRHKIAGAVAAFLGNKIDPLHGQIMQKHGEEAYRQAATHIRKVASDVKDAVSSLHDRLHKQLRTGGLVTEEVEELEELEELKRSTLASYTNKAADQMANAAIDKSTGAAMGTMGRMSNVPDLAKKGSDKEDKAFSTILKRTKGITSATRRLAKEDTDVISKYTKLGEVKYPGFRVRTTLGGPKLPRRGYGYVPQGDQDPRTGLPLGFSPAKEEPKKTKPS